MKKNIPIITPFFDKKDYTQVLNSLKSRWISQGPLVIEFEKKFADFIGAKYAVAVSSCTTALHLSLILCKIKPGDEVIVPAFTFIATANVVEYIGAKPVFVDIDLKTFNIDVNKIESAVTKKTKAVIPVHLFGLSADMNPILKIAKKYNLAVIEDAACSHGAEYKGKKTGTFGNFACFSFHPRKVITTGEGGMITTNDKELAKLASVLRNHGAVLSDLERHKKGGFCLPEFPYLGYNYRMTDFQAALGISQLEKINQILSKRIYLAERYDEKLKDIPFIQTPYVPSGYKHIYQSYVILFKENKLRNRAAVYLQSLGIGVRQGTHAVPLLSYYKNKYKYKDKDFPQSFNADQRTLALPLYHTLSSKDQDFVVDNLRKVCLQI